MKSTLITLSLLLLGAPSLVAQNLRLTVFSKRGNSGHPCSVSDCGVADRYAVSGEILQLVVHGAAGSPHFLLLGSQPAQCVAIPGIGGRLVMRAPLLVMPLAMSWGPSPYQGPQICRLPARMGLGRLPLPSTLPSRLSGLVQVAADVSIAGVRIPTLSNAVRVLIL